MANITAKGVRNVRTGMIVRHYDGSQPTYGNHVLHTLPAGRPAGRRREIAARHPPTALKKKMQQDTRPATVSAGRPACVGRASPPCDVCGGKETFQLDTCKCSWCTTCLRRWAESQVENLGRFPPACNCKKTTGTIRTLRQRLGNTFVDKCLEDVGRAAQAVPCFQCKKDIGKKYMAEKYASCPRCGVDTCRACLQRRHPGICDNTEEDEEVRALLVKDRYKWCSTR